MNRNTELHFQNTPQIDIKRSKFEVSHSHKTTFNAGDIIPIFVDSDILPGDTVQMDMAELIRMATPIYPIMDNAYCDIYWFFVPHRLVWDNWSKFWGENDDPWIQSVEYEIPQIQSPSGGWTEGSIADYFGIPTKTANIQVNSLPFRAYAKIWNDWFRDENLKKNCHIYTDDTIRTGSNGNNYVLDAELGGKPCKAAKMHDYFTSALPAPQKGPAVEIGISGLAPVTGQAIGTTGNKTVNIPELYGTIGIGTYANTPWTPQLSGDSESLPAGQPLIIGSNLSNKIGIARGGTAVGSAADPLTFKNAGVVTSPKNATLNSFDLTSNLQNAYADLSNATAMTINQLRTAFAIQKYYENAGLHGTRYIEYIRSVFGVTSSDARMQRAEYIGGTRIPINIDQILQTSSTDQTSPQGNTAGFSCTINNDSMFTKSFEEHGTLMCMAVIRVEHTYQQGLSKMWTRKKWTDFYNPFFANLGEQAILNENIYATGNSAQDKEAFGYQEAWAEYRYKNNFVSGYMRSNATGSLDVWHFADNYTQLPILGTTWIDEPYENVDRTIAVTSQLTHQFIADFYYKAYYTRPMPVYSIPGLIDHV